MAATDAGALQVIRVAEPLRLRRRAIVRVGTNVGTGSRSATEEAGVGYGGASTEGRSPCVAEPFRLRHPATRCAWDPTSNGEPFRYLLPKWGQTELRGWIGECPKMGIIVRVACTNQVRRPIRMSMAGSAAARRDYLRRLPEQAYRGHAKVHWTLSVADRSAQWLSHSSHATWREVLLHAAYRYQIAAPVYCLMPDHAHVLLVGLLPSADQRRALSFLRRFTGPMLAPARWQKQAHDHVLRDEECSSDGFRSIAHYIGQNPVRAGLVGDAAAWPYAGSLMPGMTTLDWRQDDFWPRWWKYYALCAG